MKLLLLAATTFVALTVASAQGYGRPSGSKSASKNNYLPTDKNMDMYGPPGYNYNGARDLDDDAPNSRASYPSSNSGYPSSNSGYPSSNSGYPSSNSGYPSSNSGYPSNNDNFSPSTRAFQPSNSGGYPSNSNRDSGSGYPSNSNSGGYPSNSNSGSGYPRPSPNVYPTSINSLLDDDFSPSGNSNPYNNRNNENSFPVAKDNRFTSPNNNRNNNNRNNNNRNNNPNSGNTFPVAQDNRFSSNGRAPEFGNRSPNNRNNNRPSNSGFDDFPSSNNNRSPFNNDNSRRPSSGFPSPNPGVVDRFTGGGTNRNQGNRNNNFSSGGGGGFNGPNGPGGSAGSQGDPFSEPANYNFAYEVNDPPSDQMFGHREQRQGDDTRGSYFVNLPDGRVQRVTYTAGPDGYRAQVTYDDPPGGLIVGNNQDNFQQRRVSRSSESSSSTPVQRTKRRSAWHENRRRLFVKLP